MAEKLRPISQDFTPDIKLRAKAKRRLEDDISPRVNMEIHHTIAKYLGGSGDEENAVALTLPEHCFSHSLGTFFGEPEQKPDSEWMGARQIIARMSPVEFIKYLAHMEPLIPDLKQRIYDQSPKKKR